MLFFIKFQPRQLFLFLCISTALIFLPHSLMGFNPVVELGEDTIHCGSSLVLDAGNPGATFLWNTGETTQTITVSSSDLYWVAVTDGTGVSNDSIRVQILATPGSPVLPDTSLCLGESITYTLPQASDGVLWYDSPSGDGIIGSGNVFTYKPESTGSIYASNFNYASRKIGLVDTSFGIVQYFGFSGNGEIFDVKSPIILQAVYAYTDGNSTFDLVIEDNKGTVVHTQSVTLSTPFVKTRIPIGLSLDIGEDYRMKAWNISGSGLAVMSSTTSHPYILDNLVTIQSGVSAHPPNRFWFFYDWEVDVPECMSPRVASQITLLETPVVDLGSDTIICSGNTFILDATNANASYLWNDGSTGPTFTVTGTDTISVLANIGACLASDEIEVFVFDTPGQSQLGDTTICGVQELTLTNTMNPAPLFTFWWSGSGELLEVAPSYTNFQTSNSQLLIENVNSRELQLGPKDLTSGTRIINDGFDIRGIRLNAFEDMVINSIVVFPGGVDIINLDIVLKDSNAVEVSRHPQVIIPPYSKELLDVNIFVPKGNRYSLEVQNLRGGGLLRSEVPEESYPFTVGNIASISASTTLTTIDGLRQYNYLYDLSVIPYSTACRSTTNLINVTVDLPLQLQDSIYSCTGLTLDPGFSASSFLWNTGATTSSISVNETGTYSLTVSDGANCQVTDSSFVEIPQGAGLPDDGVFCGNTLETNYDASATYLWSTGATTPTLSINSAGTYSVEVTEPRGCTLKDTIVISAFDSFPLVDLGQDQAACKDLLLDAGNPGLSYLWSTGETTQQITVSASGLYSVQVSNANDCTTEDTIGVSITPLPVAQFSVPDTVAGGVSRRVNFVNQSSFGSYLWKFGDGNTSTSISPSHTYADTGTYDIELIVTDIQNNCGTDTFRKTILVLQYPVGIEDELWDTPLRIFPNPAESFIQVEFESGIPGETSCKIFNLQGHLVFEQAYQITHPLQTEKVNIENLAPGIYMLHLKNKDQILTRKIIVQ